MGRSRDRRICRRHGNRTRPLKECGIGRGRVEDVTVPIADRGGLKESQPSIAARNRPREVRRCRDGDVSVRAVYARRRAYGIDGEFAFGRGASLLRNCECLGSDGDCASARTIARVLGNCHRQQTRALASLSVVRIDDGDPARVRRGAPFGDSEGVYRNRHHMRQVVALKRVVGELDASSVLEHRHRAIAEGDRSRACPDFVVRGYGEIDRTSGYAVRGRDGDPVYVRTRIPCVSSVKGEADRFRSTLALDFDILGGQLRITPLLRDGVDVSAHIDVANAFAYIGIDTHGVGDRLVSRAGCRAEDDPLLGRGGGPGAALDNNRLARAAIGNRANFRRYDDAVVHRHRRVGLRRRGERERCDVDRGGDG